MCYRVFLLLGTRPGFQAMGSEAKNRLYLGTEKGIIGDQFPMDLTFLPSLVNKSTDCPLYWTIKCVPIENSL